MADIGEHWIIGERHSQFQSNPLRTRPSPYHPYRALDTYSGGTLTGDWAWQFTELAKRLSMSRHWVVAQFGWVLVWIWVNVTWVYFHRIQGLPEWFSSGLRGSYVALVAITALVVQAGMLRSLMRNHGKHVRLVWGSLALFLWGVLYLVAAEMQDYLPGEILKWLLAWVVTPVIFFPFAAASSFWGWRLSWRSILRVACAWRWWLCVLLIATVGRVAEIYLDSICGNPYLWDVDLVAGWNMVAVDMLETGLWILLLGWLAVLFDVGQPNPGANVVVTMTFPRV